MLTTETIKRLARLQYNMAFKEFAENMCPELSKDLQRVQFTRFRHNLLAYLVDLGELKTSRFITWYYSVYKKLDKMPGPPGW